MPELSVRPLKEGEPITESWIRQVALAVMAFTKMSATAPLSFTFDESGATIRNERQQWIEYVELTEDLDVANGETTPTAAADVLYWSADDEAWQVQEEIEISFAEYDQPAFTGERFMVRYEPIGERWIILETERELWCELAADLSAGGSANATVLVWDGDSWEATGPTISAVDAVIGSFSGVTGDRCLVRWSAVSSQWIIRQLQC